MEKFFIKNRYGLEIVGDILIPKNPIGLAFVLHGLGGFRAQPCMQAIVEGFFENDYTVVNFDATNSIGESGGKYEDATMQKHYEDLIDVITWAKTQSWYKEPFMLAGLSLGGYAIVRYAEDHPKEVKALFPNAPVVSGKFSFETHDKRDIEENEKWKKTGWKEKISASKPGVKMYLPWSHMEERLKHDLMPNVSKLTMPVLIVVGENDTSCPLDQQKILLDAIPGPKEMIIVPGAPHTFKAPEHLEILKTVLSNWLKKI